MAQNVEIVFECYPLRSVSRLDAPLDAPQEVRTRCHRVRDAIAKHGCLNTYYLCNARCVFRLTNDDQIGLLVFGFEGTVMTDANDTKTVGSDLVVTLDASVCEWLTKSVVDWFAETVDHAVRVEFDRYIAIGDLAKTIARLERLKAEHDAGGGYIGFGL